MDTFNAVITRLFDWLLWPFGGLAPIWGLAAVAAVTGVVLLWAFGKVSNQARIRTLKARLKGHLLEMWIFRHDPVLVVKAQGRVLGNAVRYASHCSLAFVVLMIPMVLVMLQLHARYGYAPLEPGRSTILRVSYAGPTDLDEMDVRLEVPDGVRVETPALRMPGDGEVDYRISADRPGLYELMLNAGDCSVSKRLCVGEGGPALSPLRSRGWFERLTHPVVPGLPQGPLRSVAIDYPAAEVRFLGMRMHWVWPFLLISIAAGLAVRRALKVEI